MLNDFLAAANGLLWHNAVLFVILGTGILFTIWSRLLQFRAITHGLRVIRGRYDDAADPGAINHFQALSAALSATVGLGNIGGVALAISLGGPGAVFWMWVVGFFGMALKATEVTLAMLYRNVDQPDNPHGGTMWVVSKAVATRFPGAAWVGKLIGGIFCITLLTMVITGGNMFQAWNVGNITETYFGIPGPVSGVILATLVGLTIVGGIRRIGEVAGVLVPVMTLIYFSGAAIILALHWQEIPAMFALILRSAFAPAEASGAFIGGTAGYAFLYGMKRAIFSNEAGQGTSPIAHSAVKTREPVREGIVAGLEPFIDTLIVCTLTALVIIITGAWSRPAEAVLPAETTFVEISPGQWSLPAQPAPERTRGGWVGNENVFVVADAHENPQTGNTLHRLSGTVLPTATGSFEIRWDSLASASAPRLRDPGLYVSYVGAALTALAFDSVLPGIGTWVVAIAVWLFAISTMISYAYYAEQGVVFLVGERWVVPFKVVYLGLAVVATLGFFRTDAELDNLSGFGTGVMLMVNIPVLWILGHRAMAAYHDYVRRLDRGEFTPVTTAPELADVVSGRNTRS